jgi:hypothetical protein
MGFNVKKASTAEKGTTVTIPLSVNITYDEENPTNEQIQVKHVMRIPERTEREKHHQMLIKVRGNSVKTQGSTEANFWLWKQCYVSLEGYDELPETREQIIKLFDESTVLRIHAEQAAAALLNYISPNEDDIAKK